MEQIGELVASLPYDWKKIIAHPDGSKLLKNVLEELLKYGPGFEKLCPDLNDIFNAMKMTPFMQVKIIIIGQDPYHTIEEGSAIAHGLSFSVKPNKSIPPSLLNIYKCLKNKKLIDAIPVYGCLYNWAAQGVLLLNSSLTTEVSKPGYHKKIWTPWTDWLIKYISDHRMNVMFMLWGRDAQAKEKFIDVDKHYVYTWLHPSGMAQTGPEHTRFINCDNFELASEMYLELYDKEMNWNPIQTTHVYTDGACKGNGKAGAVGGYGVYFQDGPLKGTKITSYLPDATYNGVKMNQTNNRAEILAAIDALETYYYHKCIGNLIIVVDNELTMNIATKWIDDWFKYDKVEERKNADLLHRFKKILDKVRTYQKKIGCGFRFQWVRSHLKKDQIPKKGTTAYTYYLGNEIADDLANMGVKLHEQKARQIS